MKALLAHPDVPKDRDEAAIPLFLTYGYVPTPRTFHRAIRSLPPGHDSGSSTPRRRKGRTGAVLVALRFENGRVASDAEAEERFRELLRAAVRRRLVADVPLGAFLSGGLDSSAVVALMAEEAAGRVRTFTIGFEGGGDYDERAHARVVAEHFGTDHTEFVVEPRALDLIDRLVWHHDGPFGDSSAVPTYLLSELTRSHVTVALNGDGGDEVFAGYLRLYGGALSERIPRPVFSLLAAVLGLLPEPRDRKHVLRFAKRFAEAGRLPLADRYLRWNAYFTDDLERLVRPELRPHCRPDLILESFRSVLDRPAGPSTTVLTRLLELNFETYLLDDLLVKMDRMSMAHGLEARSPFLDTAVVEFGATLPDQLRMRLGKGKLLLRRAMRDVLPPSILARGKMGFGAPLGAWFRSDLAGFVRERLLDPGSALNEYLEPTRVAAVVEHHMAGAGDVSARLWALLTLESWLRQSRGAATATPGTESGAPFALSDAVRSA